MGKNGFAGGAFVTVDLEGADKVDDELEALDADMKQFIKLVGQLKRNFGVEAMVDDLNQFTLSGDRAQEAIVHLVDGLVDMEGIQKRTNVTIKDNTKEVRQAEKLARNLARAKKREGEIAAEAAAKEAETVKRVKEASATYKRLADEKAKAAAKQAAADKEKYVTEVKEAKAAADHVKRLEREKAAALKKEHRRVMDLQKEEMGQLKIIAMRQKAAGEAGVRAMKKVARETKKTNNTLSSMGKGAKKVLGAFMAFHMAIRVFRNFSWAINAVVGLVTKTADAIDEMGKKAQAMGVSMEFMSTMAFAAQQSGASVEQLSSSMSALQRNVGLLAIGGGEAGVAFEALGLSFQDLEKLSPEDQFMKVTDALAGIQDVTIRNAMAQKIFGEGAREIMTLLNDGSNGFAQYRKQAEAMGLVLTDTEKDGAAKFKNSLGIMNKTMEMLGSKIVNFLAPALEDLAVWFNALVQLLGEWEEENGANTESSLKMAEVLNFVKGTILALVAGFYLMIGTFRTAQQAWLGLEYGMYEGISRVAEKFAWLLKMLGFGTEVLDNIAEDAGRIAREKQGQAVQKMIQAQKNLNRAGELFGAAFSDNEFNSKLEDKIEDINATLDVKVSPPPITDLQLEEESKQVMKQMADFGSGASYGLEGLKKAQKNVDEKQTAILKQIASNTKNNPVPVGI